MMTATAATIGMPRRFTQVACSPPALDPEAVERCRWVTRVLIPDLHIDRPLGPKGDRVARNVGVGAFSTSVRKFIISSVIRVSRMRL
jgi:hypothetical protein